MPDFAIDTSSYPKPQAPPNALDTLGKVTAIQSGQLDIDKQKLDLVNQRFGEMAKGFTALISKPDVNEDDVRRYVTQQVKLGYVTPDMAATTINNLPPTQGLPPDKASAAIRQALEIHLQHAQTVKEAIDYHAGQPQTIDTGNAIQPINVSPKYGIRSQGLPIQKQLPTGTPGFVGGEPSFSGPNPNAVTAPPPMPGTPTVPGSVPLPMARPPVPTTGPTGPTIRRTDMEPTTFADRAAAAGKAFAPAPPPLFSEGKQAYTEDQTLAASRMQGVKPAIQALKLMPGLRTGPGTEQFNNLVATAKAWGITDTAAENDPTVLRQELEKKLAQYVGSNPIGQRSDAAQILAEAGSPNPKKQILPALMNLTKDAIALDRVQAARANAFKGKDFENYGSYRATFPQSIDERAFKLDLDDEDKSKALVTKMVSQYKNGNAAQKREADKFLNSYKIAKEQGFY